MKKIFFWLLTAALLLSMTACGNAPAETTVPTVATTEATTEPTTVATEPPIDSAASLNSALERNLRVTLPGDLVLEETAIVRGELDGAGYTLTAPSYDEENSATHNGVTVLQGNVSNLTIRGGYRSIGDTRDNPTTGTVRLTNVFVEAQTNAINFGYGKTDGILYAEGCTFYGWSSYKGFSSAFFENCTFGRGNSEAKGNLRPYISTTLVNCHFESRFLEDGRKQPYALLLRDNISGITITLENCYVDGVLLTEENAYELLEIKMYDNVLRICNTEG